MIVVFLLRYSACEAEKQETHLAARHWGSALRSVGASHALLLDTHRNSEVTNRDFKNVEVISSSVKIWSSGWATKVGFKLSCLQ